MSRATCGGCGLVCTGIEVLAGDAVTIEGTCALGDAWFAERVAPQSPLARVDGAETGLDDAVEVAATILREARAPLVRGLTQTTCEAQRLAVTVAERIGATIDPGPAPLAFQEIGASTATVGEMARAKLTLVWRADPETTHPLLKLYGDVVRVTDVPPDRAVDALWALRTLIRGMQPQALPLQDLDTLAARLRGSSHTVVLHDVTDHLEALALNSLVRDLAAERHVVTLRLRRDFNAAGAEDVVTWRTGYAGPVSLATGRPADDLGADAVLAVGAPDDGATISIGPRPSDGARVAIATAAAGVHRAGVTHRMDGVPVALYAPLPTDRPGDDQVLAAIAERLAGPSRLGLASSLRGTSRGPSKLGFASSLRGTSRADL